MPQFNPGIGLRRPDGPNKPDESDNERKPQTTSQRAQPPLGSFQPQRGGPSPGSPLGTLDDIVAASLEGQLSPAGQRALLRNRRFEAVNRTAQARSARNQALTQQRKSQVQERDADLIATFGRIRGRAPTAREAEALRRGGQAELQRMLQEQETQRAGLINSARQQRLGRASDEELLGESPLGGVPQAATPATSENRLTPLGEIPRDADRDAIGIGRRLDVTRGIREGSVTQLPNRTPGGVSAVRGGGLRTVARQNETRVAQEVAGQGRNVVNPIQPPTEPRTVDASQFRELRQPSQEELGAFDQRSRERETAFARGQSVPQAQLDQAIVRSVGAERAGQITAALGPIMATLPPETQATLGNILIGILGEQLPDQPPSVEQGGTPAGGAATTAAQVVPAVRPEASVEQNAAALQEDPSRRQQIVSRGRQAQEEAALVNTIASQGFNSVEARDILRIAKNIAERDGIPLQQAINRRINAVREDVGFIRDALNLNPTPGQ